MPRTPAVILKIDDKTKFEKVETGKTKPSELKKNESDKLLTWFNKFHTALGQNITMDDITWVGPKASILEGAIKMTYKGSSLRAHLEALANILLSIDKDKYQKMAKKLFLQGARIQKIITKHNDKSVLDDEQLENFVSYTELENKRNELGYDLKEDPTNRKLNMQHLILSLNTYIPPLRLDYLDMKVIRLGDNPKRTHTENYLIETPINQWSIIINGDKISKKYTDPEAVFTISKNIKRVTNGKELNKIITESLNLLPRKYLLVGLTSDEPMSQSTYNHLLAELFEPKHPTQNLIRKAYINHWHRLKKNGYELPEGVLKEIATRMRHSISTARSSYRKINLSNEIKNFL
jgi:hypothetical protein